MKEKIICSAIWYKDFPLIKDEELKGFCRPLNCEKGMVFCGHRHHNCMYQMIAISGKYQHQAGEEIQGFLTNKNRFVNRKEAFVIAEKNNQIIDIKQATSNSLYSEDLY